MSEYSWTYGDSLNMCAHVSSCFIYYSGFVFGLYTDRFILFNINLAFNISFFPSINWNCELLVGAIGSVRCYFCLRVLFVYLYDT